MSLSGKAYGVVKKTPGFIPTPASAFSAANQEHVNHLHRVHVAAEKKVPEGVQWTGPGSQAWLDGSLRSVQAEANIIGSPRPAWHFDVMKSWTSVRGSRLEEAVSSMGNLLAHQYPTLRVFHSVSLDPSGQKEVDLILMYRGMVVLVEAKHVAEGSSVSFLADGELMRRRRGQNGQVKKSRWVANRLDEKVAEVERLFPSLHAVGLYVFSGSAEQPGTTWHRNIGLVRFQDLFSTLEKMLRERPEQHGRVLVTEQEQSLADQFAASVEVAEKLTRHANALVRAGVLTEDGEVPSRLSFWVRCQVAWNVLVGRPATYPPQT